MVTGFSSEAPACLPKWMIALPGLGMSKNLADRIDMAFPSYDQLVIRGTSVLCLSKALGRNVFIILMMGESKCIYIYMS